MRILRTLTFTVVAALLFAGCETDERDRAVTPNQVALEQADADQPDTGGPLVNFGQPRGNDDRRTGDQPQGALVRGSGGSAVNVPPELDRRVYRYEPGFPPGTYSADGYYYSGGYRYPENAFLQGVVQDNIRQQRFVNVSENRVQAERVVQAERAMSALNRGVTGNPVVSSPAVVRQEQTASPQAATTPLNLQRHESAAAVKQENRDASQQPENRPSVGGQIHANDEPRFTGPNLENRTPGNEERRSSAAGSEPKASPAKATRRAGGEEARHADAK